MATIDNTDDLLRLVREDSNFRATMRRELLTAELLEVPQRLTALEQSTAALIEYTNATNRRLGYRSGHHGDKRRINVTKDDITGMKDDITVMKDDINVMKDDITVMKGDVNVMKDDISVTKNDVSVIKDDINGLGEAFRQEVRAQSSYRGAHAQTAANRDRVRISNLFAKFHAIRRTDAMPVRRNRLKSLVARRERRGGRSAQSA